MEDNRGRGLDDWLAALRELDRIDDYQVANDDNSKRQVYNFMIEFRRLNCFYGIESVGCPLDERYLMPLNLVRRILCEY